LKKKEEGRGRRERERKRKKKALKRLHWPSALSIPYDSHPSTHDAKRYPLDGIWHACEAKDSRMREERKASICRHLTESTPTKHAFSHFLASSRPFSPAKAARRVEEEI